MNLLYLCAFIPSPVDDGDKVRAMWTLRALSRRHRLFGFFLAPDGRTALPAEVASLCADAVVLPQGRLTRAAGALRALGSGKSLHAETFWNAAAQRRLDAACASWPVAAVHVHRLRMMPYAERLGLPYVLDCTDSISYYFAHPAHLSGWRRIYARLDHARVAAAERRWGNAARAVLAITAGEKRKLLDLGVRRPVFVTPNGLDLRRWSPRSPRTGRDDLMFLGNLAYPPNQRGLAWFLLQVAPRLARIAPGIRLTVVGGGAPGSLVRQAAAAPIPVRFTGFIRDVRTAYRRASALVCPLPFAAGMQNKALEAMAAGVPVIATPNVAAALGARAGRDVLVSGSPDGFARHCATALGGGAAVTARSRRARRFVQRQYDARTAARPVLAAAELLRRAGTRPA